MIQYYIIYINFIIKHHSIPFVYPFDFLLYLTIYVLKKLILLQLVSLEELGRVILWSVVGRRPWSAPQEVSDVRSDLGAAPWATLSLTQSLSITPFEQLPRFDNTLIDLVKSYNLLLLFYKKIYLYMHVNGCSKFKIRGNFSSIANLFDCIVGIHIA